MIKVLTGDERARALAEAREKARMDMDSMLGDARYEGEQAGLQKGMYKVAKNLLLKKMSYDDIVELTGLSIEEVKQIAADQTD